jgi:hypothetical protein
MKRSMLLLACLSAIVLVVGGVAATGAPPSPKKVTICHWTGKKYVKISVGARAFAGHMNHGRDIMPAPQVCPTEALSVARTGGRPLTATLTGAAEVPGPGDPDGRGTAKIRLNLGQGKVCFFLTASNIVLPATGAHIHVGASSAFGAVVVALIPPGTTGVSFGCVSASRDLIAAIRKNPSNYYINVHTTDFPDGAIRGQL